MLYGKKYAARTRSSSTGGRIELEHRRVALLLWRAIRPFFEGHVVALAPHSGVFINIFNRIIVLLGLWRSFADYGPYGVFNWDARYDVKQVFANCDVEWRALERCVNAHCERDYNKKIGSFGPLRPWCLPMKLT
ncbi:hypothetical protein M405DRAFT_141116 [Rhizopogon salebrosus TDB-379]|nr:hypothetical protein M405DRAFT_141116 [Rhizopogon salebrosus TDB-379]